MHTPFLISEDVRSALMDAARIGIAMVWLVAGIAKLRSPATTRAAVHQLVGVSGWTAELTVRMLPIAEVVLGTLLLLSVQVPLVASASAMMFLIFAVLIGRALIRDSLAGGGCGCFGSLGASREVDPHAGPRAIARNILLAAFAVIAVGAG